MIFVTLFLILPTVHIVVGAFQDRTGAFTLQNIRDLNTGTILVKLLDLGQDFGRFGSTWLSDRLCNGCSGDLWRRAALDQVTVDDLFGSCLQLCLCAAGLRVSGDLRSGLVGLITVFLRNNFGIVLARDLGFNILSF